ncbi:uncharacterized protein TNCV_1905951 [Trichonephila clavipes]|nr:uncharacterized protein TNCV_1905951 [Trichonephila clavipes]
MNHIATKQGETFFKPQQLGRECDVYLSARGKVSNDLMSRNPGSGVKTDGRNRLQTVSTWRQERNSSNVFVAETKPNCVLCEVKEDVFETISRFRRHKFALTTDIQKMYRQILINPDQQDLQRIIWKHELDAEILTYRLKTVTYKLSNAPFLAIRTLQQLAKDEKKSRFPLASETLLYSRSKK